MNWIKCSDKFPPYGQTVLVALKTTFIPITDLDRENAGDEYAFYTYDMGKFCCSIEWNMQFYTRENCLKLKVSPLMKMNPKRQRSK